MSVYKTDPFTMKKRKLEDDKGEDTERKMCVCVRARRPGCVQLFAAPWTAGRQFLCPWNFLGKNTFVGRHFLLQGIFPNQGSTCISFISCIGIPLPPGKPQVGRYQFQIQLLNIIWSNKFHHIWPNIMKWWFIMRWWWSKSLSAMQTLIKTGVNLL